jgi:hypothetical protein
VEQDKDAECADQKDNPTSWNGVPESEGANRSRAQQRQEPDPFVGGQANKSITRELI